MPSYLFTKNRILILGFITKLIIKELTQTLASTTLIIVKDLYTGERVLRYLDQGPFMLIDHVPVFDPNRIVNLNPKDIEFIEIVYGKRNIFNGELMNDSTYHGILHFHTIEQKEVHLSVSKQELISGFERTRIIRNPFSSRNS